MPSVDHKSCKKCDKCVQACQMKALVALGEGEHRLLVHKSERCIGCGLCAVACPNGILKMQPVSGYKPPPGGWVSYLTRYLPRYVSNFRAVRAERNSI